MFLHGFWSEQHTADLRVGEPLRLTAPCKKVPNGAEAVIVRFAMVTWEKVDAEIEQTLRCVAPDHRSLRPVHWPPGQGQIPTVLQQACSLARGVFAGLEVNGKVPVPEVRMAMNGVVFGKSKLFPAIRITKEHLPRGTGRRAQVAAIQVAVPLVPQIAALTRELLSKTFPSDHDGLGTRLVVSLAARARALADYTDNVQPHVLLTRVQRLADIALVRGSDLNDTMLRSTKDLEDLDAWAQARPGWQLLDFYIPQDGRNPIPQGVDPDGQAQVFLEDAYEP